MSTTEHSGLFITFEGPDGSGKSTQMKHAGGAAAGCGPRRCCSRPSRAARPSACRSAAFCWIPQNQDLCATTELLLMFAARAQNVEQWILPALAERKIVLSDRFTDSTLVYQGAARGLGSEVVKTVDRIACHGLVPDLTLVRRYRYRSRPGARARPQSRPHRPQGKPPG